MVAPLHDLVGYNHWWAVGYWWARSDGVDHMVGYQRTYWWAMGDTGREMTDPPQHEEDTGGVLVGYWWASGVLVGYWWASGVLVGYWWASGVLVGYWWGTGGVLVGGTGGVGYWWDTSGLVGYWWASGVLVGVLVG